MKARWGRDTERYEPAGAPLAPVRLPSAHDRPLPHPQVGGRYLNYRIRGRLARGSMGSIYEAEHLHLERVVAIKFLHPALLTDRAAVLRFLDEARAMARIGHPGIPEIFDFGQDESGNAYLIMERLNGGSLAEVREVAKPELPMALEIAAQVADALAAAHDAGVIHRDLKPENIFLIEGERLRVKLVDFGVAHPGPAGRAGLETASGCLVGTPTYMAPEQTYSGEVSPATDLYALGCVLFELISGRPVFSGSLAELVDSHRHRPVPALAAPRPIAALVAQLLDKRPDRRPASGAQVAGRLRRVAEELGIRWADPLATTDQLRRDDVDRAMELARLRLAEGTGAPPEAIEPRPPAPFGPQLEPESTPLPFASTIDGTPEPFRSIVTPFPPPRPARPATRTSLNRRLGTILALLVAVGLGAGLSLLL